MKSEDHGLDSVTVHGKYGYGFRSASGITGLEFGREIRAWAMIKV